MRALILSAGQATRLAPLSDYVPKGLVPIVNQPVLSHILRTLKAYDITDIGITYGRRSALLRDYFGDGSSLGVTITWLWESVPVGTGGALRLHREFADDQPIMVLPSDIIADIDLADLIRQHNEYPAAVTLVVAPRDLARWDGDIVVANGREGISYHFKPGKNALSDLGSCGTWIVDPQALNLIGDGFVDFSSDVLPRLPAPGFRLAVYNAGNIYQRDFGTFESYLAGNLEAVSGSAPIGLSQPIAESTDEVVVQGPVLIGADVHLEHGVQLYGPTVIGPGATIGAGARLISSVVLPGARVPMNTLVAHGIFGDLSRVADIMLGHRNVTAAA